MRATRKCVDLYVTKHTENSEVEQANNATTEISNVFR